MNTEIIQLYNSWNKKKKEIQEKSASDQVYFNERDIWWCSAGLNVGKEVYGKGKNFKRPVLVLKKLSSELAVVLPLTSQEKMGTWFSEVHLKDEKRWVMLYQIKLYDKKRFVEKIGEVSHEDFIRTKEKLDALLELSQNRHPAFTGIDGPYPKSIISIPDEAFWSIECTFCSQNEPFIAEYLNNPPNA